MAIGPGLPPGRAPTRLTPIAPDTHIGQTSTGTFVYMSMPFGQWGQRLVSYIGQPGTNNPPGVSISDQVGSLNAGAAIAPFEPPSASVEQRLQQLENDIVQVAGPSAPSAMPADFGPPINSVPLPPSFGGTGLTATPIDGQVLIGNSLTGLFNLGTITAGSGVTINNGHGAITITATGTNFISAVDANFSVVSGTLELASIASGDVIGNSTAGAAEPTAATMTAMLDRAFGSTQGDVLFRGAAAWQTLAPGVADTFLQTQGAGADVQWAGVGPGGGSTINAFVTPGVHSYTIPAGSNWFAVVLIGAGGQGGGGETGGAITRTGGAGGGGGARTVGLFRASDFSSPISITVGTGGTGAGGAGADGADGTGSLFGTALYAGGGGGGRRGGTGTGGSGGGGGGSGGDGQTGATLNSIGGVPATSGAAFGVGGQGAGSNITSATRGSGAEHGGAAGGSINTSAGTGGPGGVSLYGAGGGGAGGGSTAGGTDSAGAAGGGAGPPTRADFNSGGGGGTAGTSGGGTGGTGGGGSSEFGGQGGGGGGSFSAGTGGPGGPGGAPGGGGGGGGAGGTGGTGGVGADGACYVIAW